MAAAMPADARVALQAVEREVPLALNGKRKRDAAEEDEEDEKEDKTATQNTIDEDELYELSEELLLVIKSTCAFVPDIISRSISSAADGDSSAKRAKLSLLPAAQQDAAISLTSIEKQLAARAYRNFDDLVKDFDTAIDHFVYEHDAIDPGTLASNAPVPPPRSPLAKQARNLQTNIHDLIGVERLRHGQDSSRAVSEENKPKGVKISTANAAGQYVIGVFGADYRGRDTSRQWFASRKDDVLLPAEIDPVASAVLPTGLAVTSIQNMGPLATRKSTKSSKFGDLIPAPSLSLALRPPQPPISGVTRSQNVEWHKPAAEPPSYRPRLKDGWTTARLPRGSWLNYSAHADVPKSRTEERIKRDRALSGGGEKLDEGDLEYLQHLKVSRTRAKKSSLFRSAFSSFAPTYDDSDAVVSASERSRMWWNHTGADLYRSYAEPDTATQSLEEQLAALDPRLADGAPVITDDDMKAIDDAVDGGEIDLEIDESSGSTSTTVDDMLRDISETIEYLIIYQQDRLKVVTSPGKASTVQHPSEAEGEMYEMLKTHLLSIISGLPPAAVARLDGQKLGRLDVVTALPLDIPSYSGIIETADRSQPARPNPAVVPNMANRATLPQNASTPQPQRTMQQQQQQQPRSAYAGQPSAALNRPAMPQQYSVQQPGRYANQYTNTTAQGSPMPNGYQRSLTNSYSNATQSPYANPAAGTPTRQPSQYTARPPQAYQPRPAYQNPQIAPNQNVAGRAGSPQRPPSYNLPPNRIPYGLNQGSQMSAGHAASIYRPPSGSGPGPQGTIGALVDISPEEQQQINRRAQEKQEQLRQGSGSPLATQVKQSPQAQMPPKAPGTPKSVANGVPQGSPSPQKQGHAQQGAAVVNGA